MIIYLKFPDVRLIYLLLLRKLEDKKTKNYENLLVLLDLENNDRQTAKQVRHLEVDNTISLCGRLTICLINVTYNHVINVTCEQNSYSSAQLSNSSKHHTVHYIIAYSAAHYFIGAVAVQAMSMTYG